jgi:hypothetical protein
MATQQELDEREARLLGKEIVTEWLLRHTKDYDQSEESSKKIGDFLKDHSLVLSLENLELAFKELTAKGVKFTTDSGPSASGEHLLEDLPEVPGMNPKIFTVTDINNMDPERYKKLYFGATKAQFRARVTEILRRAKEEK